MKRSKKKNHLKVVQAEDPSVDIEESPPRDWTLPTAHWLELQMVKNLYHWAVIMKDQKLIEQHLDSWKKLLHVPRTRTVKA